MGGRGWGAGHYPQQENIELAQTNSNNDPHDEVTMGQGHRGRDLSSAPDKQPVWPNLGLGQPQTLVPGQFGMHAPSIG